ncbi:MAG: hypothetical protein PVF50_00960 [Gammaproteobacteria bacterium]|jgi:hypothetical protein
MSRISEHCRAPGFALAVIAASMLVAPGQYTVAQGDLTAPPRISEQDVQTPPEPAPERDAPSELEEIVVISDQNPWRLPDLGSAWRARQAEEQDTGRISAEVLPIWDPEAQEMPTRNPFSVTDDFRRVGFIEVFRVRFGRR